MTARLSFFSLICVLSLPILVRAQGVTTATIDEALGRSGQKTGDVYRVSFPRTTSTSPLRDWQSSQVWHWARGQLFSEAMTMPW
jgi:hypothetical protein